MKPPTRSKAMWLLFHFLVHFVGYRILQTLLLVSLAVQTYSISGSCTNLIYPRILIPLVGIFSYLTPVVGILTFFILKHGWIYDLYMHPLRL